MWHGRDPRRMHPVEVVHLEHDGRVLLVDETGKGPCLPKPGRVTLEGTIRLPTVDEVLAMGIPWDQVGRAQFDLSGQLVTVLKGYPNIAWPRHWALKDDLISDNSVHPVAREAIYRSVHRLVSKVMICNDANQVLMGRVERGHFRGYWTLPGGYMDHNEHPKTGCVRETKEELGLDIELTDDQPVVTQSVFTEEGISFVSFTYRAVWNGDLDTLTVQTEEIAEVQWFDLNEARTIAVSHFDREALQSI
ncbi:NUDIX hydrolase [Euryarchaeota archaeon]|nr:NUDIX hydrolase [Euryarchaeota archaeon]